MKKSMASLFEERQLPNLYMVMLSVLICNLLNYTRILALPDALALTVGILSVAVIPGLLFLKSLKWMESGDVLEIFPKSFFLSLVMFTPFALGAYYFKWSHWLFSLLYQGFVFGLWIMNYRTSRKFFNGEKGLKGGDWYYWVYLIGILLFFIIQWQVGLSLRGSDTAEMLSGVRKLAENFYISPYSAILKQEFISHYYGYNTWLLFLGFITRCSGVDTIYTWQVFIGISCIFTMLSVYVFVKILTGNIRASIFSSILFWFILFRGTVDSSILSIVGIGLLIGNMALPSWITPAIVIMQVVLLMHFIRVRKHFYLWLPALGALTLFSIHGQAILIYTVTFSGIAIISGFYIKKDPVFLKRILLIGVITLLINSPYLWIAKLASQTQYTDYVGEENRMETFWKDKRQYRFLSHQENGLYKYKLKVFSSYPWMIYIGFGGLPFLYLVIRDKRKALIFVSSVLAPVLFLINPYFVTYGEKYLSLPQIHRLGAWHPFLKISILLSISMAFEGLAYILEKIKERGRPFNFLDRIFQLWPCLVLAGCLLAYHGQIIASLERYYVPPWNSMHWRKIDGSEFIGALRNKVPPGSVIFNADGRFFPISVFSNQYVTFAKLPILVVSSPIAMAHDAYRDKQQLVKMLKNNQLDAFFKLIDDYNCEYVVLLTWQVKKIQKTETYQRQFKKIAGYDKWHLYRVSIPKNT